MPHFLGRLSALLRLIPVNECAACFRHLHACWRSGVVDASRPTSKPIHKIPHLSPLPFIMTTGRMSRRESVASTATATTITSAAISVDLADIRWPPGSELPGIDQDDLREAAYEIFFTACRSSPGFGSRQAVVSYSEDAGSSGLPASPRGLAGLSGLSSSPRGSNNNIGVGMAVTSRVKKALGLKMIRRSFSSRRSSSVGSAPAGRAKRPMTSAEIMRQQMRVTEQNDNRLRKTLMRTLVGQIGRRADSIILPLELLRHLKPSEFNDSHEYHIWQKRQLKILESGLVLHPLVPLDKSDELAIEFNNIIRMSERKAIDTGRNSETMKTLSNCVVALASRLEDGTTNTEVCHWADGYPLNIHIYISLLQSIFDLRDDCLVLDEVDELLELMKKTWSTLGLNRSIHNLCLTWVLFRQYVATGQVDGDLLGATLAMLNEVASDAKRGDKEPAYVKLLSVVLGLLKKWGEKRLIDYHNYFHRGTTGLMEYCVPLVLSATRILEENVGVLAADQEGGEVAYDSKENKVDRYIRSSLKYAFAELLVNEDFNGLTFGEQEVTESLIELAKEIEQLAMKEKDIFSPVLKKWHPISAGVAAVTLHNCYGTLLKQYLGNVTSLSNEMIRVLHSSGQLEKALVQMVVEDSIECEDGGKTVVREMVPYEVDSIIMNLLRQWIKDKVKMGRECLQRAKETETWNPKSKTEPYAQSSIDLMRIAKEAVDEFLEIPICISEDLVHDLCKGFEPLFREYSNFVASCGSKQSYIPTLPPLTRCNRDSKFFKLFKRASPCTAGVEDPHQNGENNQTRPSTSRGTQRLYIRLNTLHYFLSQLHSIEKTLSLCPRILPSPRNRRSRPLGNSYYFETATIGLETAILHVSEVAAYRLIFLDSNYVFYDTLYLGDVENARIQSALRILKQNLTLLCAIVMDRAQPLAMKEVMKASYEAFLMVLLAGGSSRTYLRSDFELIEEDFENLKRVFATSGEGLISESVVDQEAEIAEGVVALMGQSTEQLIEDFSTVACEASGIGMIGAGQKLPMPPTTGRWNRSDPNTILRVLCHRNDRGANHFLKTTFQLAKRR